MQTSLNYWVDFKVLRSSDFGLPQKRERIFIIGFDRDHYGSLNFEKLFDFPLATGIETRVGAILQSHNEIDEKYTISQRLLDGHIRRKREHKEKGNGFGFSVFRAEDKYTNTLSARYYKDGSEILISQEDLGRRPRKLTPRECLRLMGFRDDFKIVVSNTQLYRQAGNSIVVDILIALLKKIDITKYGKDIS